MKRKRWPCERILDQYFELHWDWSTQTMNPQAETGDIARESKIPGLVQFTTDVGVCLLNVASKKDMELVEGVWHAKFQWLYFTTRLKSTRLKVVRGYSNLVTEVRLLQYHKCAWRTERRCLCGKRQYKRVMNDLDCELQSRDVMATKCVGNWAGITIPRM